METMKKDDVCLLLTNTGRMAYRMIWSEFTVQMKIFITSDASKLSM
jgi:hypothetical protein